MTIDIYENTVSLRSITFGQLLETNLSDIKHPFYISLPILGPDSSQCGVFITKRGDKWMLSDLGKAFGYLWDHKIESSNNALRFLIKHLDTHGYIIEGNELLLMTDKLSVNDILDMAAKISTIKHACTYLDELIGDTNLPSE
ncbi:hypothetical protein LCGC14_0195660 [marine sediment metagenome]|uniref:Uncharacterized protein n=1 Tax=marine sediment metagenome TaxID=412755 RepID=A0A0F9XNE9_9ZZZZ